MPFLHEAENEKTTENGLDWEQSIYTAFDNTRFYAIPV